MLRAKINNGTFILGLDAENINRLKKGQPILVSLAEMGGTDDVLIMAGETLSDIAKNFRSNKEYSMNYLIYDIEIKKAILGKNENPIEGIEYCQGWHDHENMGISCIGAYESWSNRYRVFMDDNKNEFIESVNNADVIVGFNNIAFDNAVISKCWDILSILNDKSYDILVEIWKANGLSETFKYPTHVGFGLDACCSVNFGTNKTGSGAYAPVNFQSGKYGLLIDYCLNDVKLTKDLFDLILLKGEILNPRDNRILKMSYPMAVIKQ